MRRCTRRCIGVRRVRMGPRPARLPWGSAWRCGRWTRRIPGLLSRWVAGLRSQWRRCLRVRRRRRRSGPGCADPCGDRYRRGLRRAAHRTLVAANVEGQSGPVGIADVQSKAVGDVDHRHALIVDEHPVQAAVVDGQPPALVEPQDQVRPGDQGMGHTDVGAQVTANHHVVARGEVAGRPVVPDGQRGRGGSRHRVQLYRFCVRAPRRSRWWLSCEKPPRVVPGMCPRAANLVASGR